MWSSLTLKCPVSDVCQYGYQDGIILMDFPNLVSVLTAAAEVLTEDNPIWTEIKVFQNIQTKYKRILHCDKGLLLLQRIGGCLRKMVLLNLSKSYLDLAEHLLLGLQNQSQKRVLLPSRQQLEYVLIRTQSAAKLICETLHHSRETFCYLIQRLRVGHLVMNLMMATSVTARLNIFLKGILVQIFDLYRQLYSWRNKLKIGTFEWPRELNLPDDLEKWLDSDFNRPKFVLKEQLDFLTNFFKNGTAANQGSDSESVVEMKSDDEVDISVNTTTEVDTSMNTTFERSVEYPADVGEVIARGESGNTKDDSKPKELTESQRLLLNKIQGAKTLKKLKIIWNNLNVSSPDLLPSALTPAEIRLIDKMFAQLKSEKIKIKGQGLSVAAKKEQLRAIATSGSIKFAKHLGLIENKSKGDPQSALNDPLQNLKPVKTFKELKNLYQTLYNMLQSTQQYEKCDKLRKVFRSRKADIKLLIQNNEKVVARKLIYCTSKVFLTRYKN